MAEENKVRTLRGQSREIGKTDTRVDSGTVPSALRATGPVALIHVSMSFVCYIGGYQAVYALGCEGLGNDETTPGPRARNCRSSERLG